MVAAKDAVPQASALDCAYDAALGPAGVGVALALTWVALVIALLVARPKRWLLTEALRLLPDVLCLLRRLAGDRSLPRGVRIRLWLLLGYLAIPIDLVPDFIPVLGYADDAIIATAVLRSVMRRAGFEPIRGHGQEPTPGWAPFCGCGLAGQPDRRDSA